MSNIHFCVFEYAHLQRVGVKHSVDLRETLDVRVCGITFMQGVFVCVSAQVYFL